MSKKPEIVTSFLYKAAKLLNTKQQFSDIYNEIFVSNQKQVYAEYFDVNNKTKKYRYRDMQANINKYAQYFVTHIEKKDTNRVILKLANCPSWGEVFWGLLMSGFVPILLDAKLGYDNTVNVAKQSKAIAIVTDDINQYDFTKIKLISILQNAKKPLANPVWADEVMFSSSGTTGDAKLMVFNGANFVNQICCSLDMGNTSVDIMYPQKYGKIKILAMVPFHHIFGFVAVFLWYTFYGTTLVFPKSNTPTDLLSVCQKAGVTHVYSVPLFWDSLSQSVKRKFALQSAEKQALLEKMIAYNLKEIDAKEAGLASKKFVNNKVKKVILGKKVVYCISGGGYLSLDTLKTVNGLGYPLYNGYGMTEVGVTSVELSPDVKQRLLGYIGKPLHGVTYKVDSKTNELLIKSPTIHVREIIGGVEKDTVLDDGFLHTGDIVKKEATGFLMKGRSKDVIINENGENIFPDELEIYFKDLQDVVNLCVLGVANSNNALHEDIVLVLELSNHADEDSLKKIEKQVRATTLPHNTKIARIYFAKNHLPLANNMKVKRFLIKKDIENGSSNYLELNGKKEKKSTVKFPQEVIDNVVPKVRNIFSKTVFLPTFKINDEDHWIDDLGGDSMNYVEMVQRINQEFNIEIEEEKYGLLTCVNDFVTEIVKLKKNALISK